jgi:nicotinamidase-related amidase
MSFSPRECFVLLVDFQARLMPAISGADAAVANALKIAEAARLLDIPVLATEQNPNGLGANLPAITVAASATLTKMHFDATREPAWAAFAPKGLKQVVVAGCETHVCVLQTVMGLLAKGYQVRLVADAVGSRTVENRQVALHRAERHGAEIVTTEMVVFEWLKTCEHPKFKDVLKAVK